MAIGVIVGGYLVLGIHVKETAPYALVTNYDNLLCSVLFVSTQQDIQFYCSSLCLLRSCLCILAFLIFLCLNKNLNARMDKCSQALPDDQNNT